MQPLHDGPLTDFVPSAGLRWMLVGRPQELAGSPELHESLRLLFPERRLGDFANATGVDLAQTPTALAAQFDYATLYLAESTGQNAVAEERFLERLVSEPIRTSIHPRITRATGLVGTKPETLVRIDNQLIAVSVGDPTPARVVELFALGRLRRSVPALEGSALSTLPGVLEEAVLRGYAPGPFTGEWTRGARGLLSGAVAAGAGVFVEGADARLLVVLSGDWDAGTDLPQLLGAWEDLSRSSLGRLLALDDPVKPVAVDARAGYLEIEATLRLPPLLAGLHAAVAADVWQLMDFSRRPAPSENPPPTR